MEQWESTDIAQDHPNHITTIANPEITKVRSTKEIDQFRGLRKNDTEAIATTLTTLNHQNGKTVHQNDTGTIEGSKYMSNNSSKCFMDLCFFFCFSEASGSRNYDRDRDINRERKMEHHHRRRKYKDEKDDGNYEWGKRDKGKSEESETKKEKPNFGLSGKLAEDTNKVNGVVIKYAEPPEARIPKKRWRLYPFKGEQSLPTLYIHRQSCYLVGRDRKICDIPVDHPSCSKQHAALQYRLMPYERNDGTEGKRVIPYIIDLESANGTFLNNKQIDAKKYVQLMEKDVLKFGFSTREYVILHENAKDDETDEQTGSPSVEVKREQDE